MSTKSLDLTVYKGIPMSAPEGKEVRKDLLMILGDPTEANGDLGNGEERRQQLIQHRLVVIEYKAILLLAEIGGNAEGG